MTVPRMAFAYQDAARFAYRHARHGHDSDPWYREFRRALLVYGRLVELCLGERP